MFLNLLFVRSCNRLLYLLDSFLERKTLDPTPRSGVFIQNINSEYEKMRRLSWIFIFNKKIKEKLKKIQSDLDRDGDLSEFRTAIIDLIYHTQTSLYTKLLFEVNNLLLSFKKNKGDDDFYHLKRIIGDLWYEVLQEKKPVAVKNILKIKRFDIFKENLEIDEIKEFRTNILYLIYRLSLE